MMSGQNPHPGDMRHGQIPVGCPTPPLGLDIDRCITTGYFDRRLSSIATQERVASFLNFVPFDLETTTTVEGSCLQNFISVAKLHLFHAETNDNVTVVMEAAWPSG